MRPDAVLSYHLNPNTCGVAKFNHQLARRLGVPCASLDKHPFAYPIISVKGSEIKYGLSDWPMTACWYRQFDLFLHDDGNGLARDGAIRKARRVYVGNSVLAEQLAHCRTDIITAWCPSTVDGNATRGAYRVLTFGMAHKLVLPYFKKLKIELDRDHPDYTIELSTAVHEGSPWDQSLTDSVEAMRGIFGDRLRVLGYLADDALAKELADVDAVAAFFTPAFRANNTSAWAALTAGKKLYTNTDAHSPEPSPSKFGWDALIAMMAG